MPLRPVLRHPTARPKNVCPALGPEYACSLPPPQIRCAIRSTDRSIISRSSARPYKLEQGGSDDHRRRRIRTTLDTAPSARPKASADLQIPRFPSVLVISCISVSVCSWRDPINRSSTGSADRIHVPAELCMILLSQNQPRSRLATLHRMRSSRGKLTEEAAAT